MDPKVRELAIRLIALYNEHYAQIFMAAQRRGRDEVLRRDLSAFFGGSTGIAELFRELAFGDDGKLPAEGVLRNLAGIRTSQKLELLYQGLSELLDFVLFSAMEAVERHDEQALEQRVGEILKEAGVARDRSVGDASIGVVDLGRDGENPVVATLSPSGLPHLFEGPAFDDLLEPRTAPTAPDLSEALRLGAGLPTFDSDAPMPPSGLASVAIVPYLPDAQAYELASGLRACRSEAALARECAEQIGQRAESVELREAALRAAEHAASVVRALDQLDQLVARLRRR